LGAFQYFADEDIERIRRYSAKGSATARLRRLLRLYGPTGNATSWQLWMDAWSLAIRDESIRGALKLMDKLWRQTLEAAIIDGVELGEFVCPDPQSSVFKISALTDGLSIASLLYRSVTRTQLRSWILEATAREVGLDKKLRELGN